MCENLYITVFILPTYNFKIYYFIFVLIILYVGKLRKCLSQRAQNMSHSLKLFFFI